MNLNKQIHQTALNDGKQALNEAAIRQQIDLQYAFSFLRKNIDSLASVFQRQLEKASYDQSWENIEAALTSNVELTYYVGEDHTVFSSNKTWQQEILTDLDLDNNIFYRIARDPIIRRGQWSQVYRDDILDMWVVYYTVPIYKKGEFVGVFGGAIDIDPIIEKLELMYDNSIGQFFIYDSRLKMIYHPDYGSRLIRQENNNLSAGYIRDSLKSYIESKRPFGSLTEFIDWNKKVYAISNRIDSINWTIVTYQNETGILKGEDERFYKYLIWITFNISLLCSVVYFSCKLFIARKLTQTAQAVANVDLNNPQLNFKGHIESEIEDLHSQLTLLVKKFEYKLNDKNKNLALLKEEVESNKALAQAVSYSDNAVIILELDFAISYVDSKAIAMLKCDRETLLGSRFFSFIHEHMAFISEQIVNEIRRKKSWHGELVLKEQSNGQQVWVNSTITPMRDENSNVTKYVLSMQDISFIKDSQNKIEKLAYTDELTGLANRTFFIAQLEKLVEISKRGRYEFALFYFDVDDFKRVNDIYGHENGDLLLVEIANRLNKNLRNEDVLARMGGDEFALIMGGARNEQDALNIAHDILTAANRPFELRGEEVVSGTSIGITLSTKDTKEAETLLQHADLAMYEAKATGKNTYHFYTKELNEAAKERQEIESALKLAILNDELELYYQPKVHSLTKDLVGFEALLRWSNDKLGFVSPAKFIPIAEQSSLILQIGSWVMRQACTFAASDDIHVPVSINLSACQFESGDCISELKTILQETGVSPSRIELEITESHLMSDVEDAIRQLNAIKELGVAISIDDFGTGYSSLSYLKRFPVDTLKIDRSFIKDIPEDVNDLEITGAIIAMAHKLGLEVIAEGAETQAQVDFLEKNGCYLVQGYFFSKPIPATQARVWKYTTPSQVESS
ncbi:EAL domain-containing protein [Psychrosphaera sp. 1_MG-2023]|uniref:bifunctional diguanylate cyclase/phosphodiesterase n=1 Tax=Psychrosphaera sp. 1_MG-2023 TaxID=3062643 RepID=UPI0026E25373|nr:EAL domain-containing protein [Psychrosphaera sp. 1_MG-2023]MDO6719496.1 EAL domain-containing protein [Psychrosphaera sp. 1_MG-2023]